MVSSEIPVNYELFFHFFNNLPADGKNYRILDYGCGSGLLVREGLKRGYRIFGVDNFYEDSSRATEILSLAKADGLPIRVITAQGSIPYPDSFFNVIISNMVIEHIADLDFVVAELHRVLRGGGVMLHIFPTRERIMEGHIGLPLVHWFPKHRKIRWLWAFLMRKLGFGFGWGINTRPDHEWVTETLDWVDHYVYYRSWRIVERSFSRYFDVKSYTRQQLDYHLAYKRGVVIRIMQWLLRFASTATFLERLQWLRLGRAIACYSRK
jgi:SAM-dependent methyltransferase